jgi:hypothetical protein
MGGRSVSGADKTVYRTERPEVVALRGKWSDAHREMCARRDCFLSEHAPEGAAAQIVEGVWGRMMVGISLDGRADEVPDGWRLDPRQGFLVPRRNTRRGKTIVEALGKVRMANPRDDLPGMPSLHWAGRSFAWPAVEFHGEAMYVVWGGGGPPAEEIDSDVWERVRLSEWYAMVERYVDDHVEVSS